MSWTVWWHSSVLFGRMKELCLLSLSSAQMISSEAFPVFLVAQPCQGYWNSAATALPWGLEPCPLLGLELIQLKNNLGWERGCWQKLEAGNKQKGGRVAVYACQSSAVPKHKPHSPQGPSFHPLQALSAYQEVQVWVQPQLCSQTQARAGQSAPGCSKYSST